MLLRFLLPFFSYLLSFLQLSLPDAEKNGEDPEEAESRHDSGYYLAVLSGGSGTLPIVTGIGVVVVPVEGRGVGVV